MPAFAIVKSVPAGVKKIYSPKASGVAGQYWHLTGVFSLSQPAIGSRLGFCAGPGMPPFVVGDTGEVTITYGVGGALSLCYFRIDSLVDPLGTLARATLQGLCTNSNCSH